MANTNGKEAAASKGKDFSYLSSPIVQIIVGLGELSKTFFAHKDLITSRSKFFEKALKNYAERKTQADTEHSETATKSNPQQADKQATDTACNSIMWKEGEDGVVKLRFDEPDVFATYVQLIYTGVLPVGNLPSHLEKTGDGAKRPAAKKQKVERPPYKIYASLTPLYIFCDKIQDGAAKSALIAAFVEVSFMKDKEGNQFLPSNCELRDVYAGTLADDPLRAWLAGGFAIHGQEELSAADYNTYPQEFMYDTMLAMYRLREAPEDMSQVESVKYYQDKLLKAGNDAVSGPGSDSE